MTKAEQQDLVTVITQDHRDVKSVFDELPKGEGGPQHRRELADHMIADSELRDLGEKVLTAKDAAPTQPHPSSPKQPPANLVLDPGAGLVDKVRDGLSGRHA